MLRSDAFKLKASTRRNRLPPFLSEMLLKFSAPPPPRLISSRVSSYFRILKIAQSVGRTGATDAGGAGGTGRAPGHLRRSSARGCCAPGPRPMEVPPSFLQLFLYHSFFLLGRSSPARPQEANRHSQGQKAKPPLRLSVQFMVKGGKNGKGAEK